MNLYHNPRCSKSREALAALEQRGYAPTLILYQSAELDAQTISGLIERSGMAVEAFIRAADVPKDTNLKELSAAQAAMMIVAEPKLLQRPILDYRDRVAIGRPLQAILALLD